MAVQRPCTLGDGVEILSEDTTTALADAARSGRLMAFVPASGAATRMFSVDVDRSRLAIEGEWDAAARLPKGLVPFHRYPDGSSRTAFAEHLVESEELGCDRLHFTVSASHKSAFEAAVPAGVEVGFSVQDPGSDTPCITADGAPIRDDTGNLFFRPGGHGALISNLAATDGDVVLIKNIDNVVPDWHRAQVLRWRGRLAGRLLELQQRAFALLRAGDAVGAGEFCRGDLGLEIGDAAALDQLDRPIRVCGMVKNEGEPGGGPFWVPGQGVQIVEKAQIDAADPATKAVMHGATHFNPVDLVCGVRDLDGKAYDLAAFVEPAAVIITHKRVLGVDAVVLEHPGLWNGAMGRWNTIFAEMPIETFNPVKTVRDLLRPLHQPVS